MNINGQIRGLANAYHGARRWSMRRDKRGLNPRLETRAAGRSTRRTVVAYCGDPDGAQGRQYHTVPRWGGLVLVSPHPPLVLIRGGVRKPLAVRTSASQLPLFKV